MPHTLLKSSKLITEIAFSLEYNVIHPHRAWDNLLCGALSILYVITSSNPEKIRKKFKQFKEKILHGMSYTPCHQILTSSKTFLSPFWVRAEHSTYFTALNSFASRSPISKLSGFCLFFAGKGRAWLKTVFICPEFKISMQKTFKCSFWKRGKHLASRLLPHHPSSRSESQLGGRGSSDNGVWFLAPI